MKEPIYRITVEVIGDEDQNHKVENTYEPIECNGFVIMGDNDEKQELCVHKMSAMDIAKVINSSGVLFASGILAKAMKEANEIVRKENAAETFKKLFDL